MANNDVKTKVITGVVRLSYVHVYAPHAANEGADEKYSVSVIIPKSDKATISKINAAIKAATEKGKTDKWGGKVPANLKLPIRDGDEDRGEDEAYADSYFINCTSNNQPGMVDLQCNELIEPDAIYSGVYARVSINFYPFNKSGNKGIAAGLNNIQKVKDGERLAGGASAESDFNDGFGDDFEVADDFMD